MIDEKARDAAVAVAKEMVADKANHWEIADAVIEAYEAAKPVAVEIDSRLDMAWADGAKAAMNALDQYLPDSAAVRGMDRIIARRQADAIEGRKLAKPAPPMSASGEMAKRLRAGVIERILSGNNTEVDEEATAALMSEAASRIEALEALVAEQAGEIEKLRGEYARKGS